ncbi:MAG: C4-type zinc ribbon domain-containing protein [Elusimicrobiales bacterium]|nr:C4-type zinc ribbon domain-containing protein [Elusimicrobiales bacterium]
MAEAAHILKVVVGLQQKDSALDMLLRQRQALPAEIERVKGLLAEKQSGLNAYKENHKKLLLARKELERNLKEKEDAIRKHQGELNAVKSNEAYRALQTEIDTLKKQADECETGILSNMEAAEVSTARERELAALYAQEQSASAKSVAELEAQLAALDEKLSAARAERKTMADSITPAEALDKYEKLRELREGLGICEVKKDRDAFICTACNMRVPPHLTVDIRKPGALVYCDSCQRLIFSKEALGI